MIVDIQWDSLSREQRDWIVSRCTTRVVSLLEMIGSVSHRTERQRLEGLVEGILREALCARQEADNADHGDLVG